MRSELLRSSGIVGELLRDPKTAVALLDIRRRAPASAREDLLERIDRLQGAVLDSSTRLAVFDDVIAAFCPSGFHFKANPDECRVAPAPHAALIIDGELWNGGQKVATLRRHLNVQERFAYHEFLRAEPEFRGTALAPLVLRQSFLYFDRIGIERAVVEAGLETGTYYWARCGFDFLRPAERAEVIHWVAFILATLRRDIDITGLTAAYQLATIGKASDEHVSFAEIARALQPAGVEPDLQRGLTDIAIANGFAYETPIDLGKAILLAYPKTWWGYLDLDITSGQRTIFETYMQSRIRIMAR